MLNFLKIITESIKLAYFELVNNKLRSFLSLLGITIGIFCIIGIFTAVDFLNTSVEDSFKEIGEDVLYVEKDPWVFTPDTPWWEFMKRDYISYNTYEKLKEKLRTAESVGYLSYLGEYTLRTGKEQLNEVPLVGITNGEEDILNITIDKGRFFTQSEERGSNVVLLGNEVADELFGEGVNPVGSTIRMKGKKLTVVGVLKDKDNLLGIYDLRGLILVPHNYVKTMLKISPRYTYQRVGVKVAKGYHVEQAKDEIRGVMRGARGLRPIADEDFAINRVTLLLEFIKQAQDVLRMAGFFLGIFALVIGGFGIANIMFVSVKERTKYIGIKKAIGAKQWVILTEFLIESVALCLLGSLMGLLLVWILSLIASGLLKVEFALSMKNILFGIGLSVFIGVLAGIIPAWMAARMDPVKAIRS